MDQEDYQKQIELAILRLIEERLKSGEMNAQQAQEIARYVLQVFPSHMTLEEIYMLVPSLSKYILNYQR
jgi:hypothetical protein